MCCTAVLLELDKRRSSKSLEIKVFNHLPFPIRDKRMRAGVDRSFSVRATRSTSAGCLGDNLKAYSAVQ